MDDDGYDDYTRYQKASPNKKPPPTRYEVARPSLKSLQASMKAKILTVYTNGDKYIHDKPITISFRIKAYPQLNSLLDDIARRKERINKTLVKYLYKWPSGDECVDVHEISEDDDTTIYVVSDTKRLYKKGCYGGVEFGGQSNGGGSSKYSRNSHNSRGTMRSEKVSPVAMRNWSVARGQPVNITVISNTNRHSRQSLFIDPKSNLPFESILQNVTDMLDMDRPPCVALYSVKPPYKKVDSISSFNRIVPQYGDTFWACGKEGEPFEKSEKSNGKSRDSSPMRDGYAQQQRGKNGNPRQNGYHDSKGRQSDTFEDSQGREYKRYKSEENGNYGDDGESEYDDYNEQSRSPARRQPSPKRQSPPRRQSPPGRRNEKPRQSQSLNRADKSQSPQRKGNRDSRAAPPKSNQTTPRKSDRADSDDERDDKKGRNRKNDDRDDKRGKDSDDEDDRSRSNSPTEEEMQERIDEMDNPKNDLDDDVDY